MRSYFQNFYNFVRIFWIFGRQLFFPINKFISDKKKNGDPKDKGRIITTVYQMAGNIF